MFQIGMKLAAVFGQSFVQSMLSAEQVLFHYFSFVKNFDHSQTQKLICFRNLKFLYFRSNKLDG